MLHCFLIDWGVWGEFHIWVLCYWALCYWALACVRCVSPVGDVLLRMFGVYEMPICGAHGLRVQFRLPDICAMVRALGRLACGWFGLWETSFCVERKALCRNTISESVLSPTQTVAVRSLARAQTPATSTARDADYLFDADYMFGQSITEHNPAPSRPGHPLLRSSH